MQDFINSFIPRWCCALRSPWPGNSARCACLEPVATHKRCGRAAHPTGRDATPPGMWLCWRPWMPLTKIYPAPRYGTFCGASFISSASPNTNAWRALRLSSLQPEAFGGLSESQRQDAAHPSTPRLDCRTAQARSSRAAGVPSHGHGASGQPAQTSGTVSHQRGLYTLNFHFQKSPLPGHPKFSGGESFPMRDDLKRKSDASAGW